MMQTSKCVNFQIMHYGKNCDFRKMNKNRFVHHKTNQSNQNYSYRIPKKDMSAFEEELGQIDNHFHFLKTWKLHIEYVLRS